MTKQEIYDYFGGPSEAAQALGITQGAVSKWIRIPPLRAIQIEKITNGQLRASDLLKDNENKKGARLHES